MFCVKKKIKKEGEEEFGLLLNIYEPISFKFHVVIDIPDLYVFSGIDFYSRSHGFEKTKKLLLSFSCKVLYAFWMCGMISEISFYLAQVVLKGDWLT